MLIWRGFSRETEVAVEVELLGCGAGRIVCRECGGDGDWLKFHQCKGTGWVLVSVSLSGGA
jgi:hypothetical protein